MEGKFEIVTPDTIRFGAGSVNTLKEEVKKFGSHNILIISDKGILSTGLVDKISSTLEDTGVEVTVFTDIQGEPTFKLLTETVKEHEDLNIDLVIGVGGGSALDIAKAVAALFYKNEINPLIEGTEVIPPRTVNSILLPTTSGTGAEVTMNAIFGDEELGVKRGLVSPALLPDTAILDPELTITCPPKVTASSGVDALTHALESFIAVKSNTITKMYSQKAIELFPEYIYKAVHHGSEIEARTGMSMVSNLAGVSLANAGVGAVHALAYPLGGKYHIEHGIANALLMPYVFNIIGKSCAPEMVQVAKWLQLGDYSGKPNEALHEVVDYLKTLLHDLDLPTSLKELGVEETYIEQLSEQASKVERLLLNTPYKLSVEKINQIYLDAYYGNEMER